MRQSRFSLYLPAAAHPSLGLSRDLSRGLPRGPILAGSAALDL